MPSELDILSFTLSDADLKAAIELLRGQPKDGYRQAWIMLIVELERRRLRAPPAEIRLARDVFDALPKDAQEVLRRQG